MSFFKKVLAVAVVASTVGSSLVVYRAIARGSHPLPTPESTLPLQRIAFGSCVHQDRPQPIWGPVASTSPDVFIMMGDNIYGDTQDMAVMRRKYDQQAGNPDYARFAARTPIIGIWDDHDYGVNDGGVEYPMKEPSKGLMLDFFGEPQNTARRSRPGVFESYVYGPPGRRTQIILLDTRWFRSRLLRGRVTMPPENEGEPDREINGYIPNPDPSSTLLGAEQWQWLEEQLRVPADVRFIGTSIQFTSEQHPYEKWSNFPHERARLLGLLNRYGVTGKTIFLSGDRHHGELSCENGLCDLTSSGLSHGRSVPLRETNRHRVGAFDQGNHFGLVTIDWPDFGENRPVRVHLELRDGQGSPTSVSRVVELR